MTRSMIARCRQGLIGWFPGIHRLIGGKALRTSWISSTRLPSVTAVTCSKLRVLFSTANKAWMVRNRLPRRKEGCLVLLGQHRIAANGLANLNHQIDDDRGDGVCGGQAGGRMSTHGITFKVDP